MWRSCCAGFGLFIVAVAGSLATTPTYAAGLDELRIFRSGYPRAYFFRAAEGFASNRRFTYERWEQTFRRLMGIMGKALDEEVPGRSVRNIAFFTRFRERHPDQVVLLHYNGNARDPRYQTEGYFAGHWIYYNGARILSDVPAEEGETDIRVDEPRLFRVNMGRYRKHNEDVGLCMLDDKGRPNWHAGEQVQLVSVDARRGILRVRRGCYGTKPRGFPAGRAYAAAHATEGPWGRRSNLMWFYNYSTRCPRDKRGRACSDVHVEELARRFSPGGELAAFDGIEFDVLAHQRGGRGRGRGLDCDADGRADNGIFDGVNTYGIGVVEFCRKLRQKLGGQRLILADGMSPRNQRAFRILNGIESEGWPTLSDWAVRDWSGGLNRHWFWARNAHPPGLNYVNHKFVTRGGEPGRTRRPEVPWSIHRLVFAAAVFTDSAICYSFAPPGEEGEVFGIWDELKMGTANQLGWLGKPLGPAVRLAEKQPDLLRGQGKPVTRDLLRCFSGAGARFAMDGDALKVTATSPGRREMRFRLSGVPCDGPDLFVSLTARGQPMRGYPSEVARLMWVGIGAPQGLLTRPELPATGMCLRGGEERALAAGTGATVRWVRQRRLGKRTHSGYFVHPPWKGGVGYAFWEHEVRVPKGGRLDFYLGMGEKSPKRSDGVIFRVLVAEVSEGKAGAYEPIFERAQKASVWTHHSVSLRKWGGKTVRLKFISDCGPKDNSTTDHSYWADVWVLGPEGLRGVTRATRFMTWVNDADFTSGFYFSEVRSRQVDLEFLVEGSAPVWLSRVAAYAHPDVIYRAFERGLVLANPSPRAYVFDLAKLFPGQSFRRLRGSSRQDPKTNDGSPVGGELTLGPKDALFLVKTARR